MTLFERISELAKKQHIGLKELAVKLGLSESAIYQWRKSSPKSESLEKVANYFDVSVDYLLGRTDNSSPVTKPEEGFLRLNMTDLTPEEREEVEKDIDDIYQLALQKIKKRREMINRD